MSYQGISHSIRCPQCNANSEVKDSRPILGFNGTRRRRGCSRCNHRFTTYEYIDDVNKSGLKRYLKAAVAMKEALGSIETLLGKDEVKVIEHGPTNIDTWNN